MSNGQIKWKKFMKINKFLEIEFDIEYVLLECVTNIKFLFFT